jgi:hypothetical protein
MATSSFNILKKEKQIEKIARCKRQSKEQALNTLKAKVPDKDMFDIAMKKYTQKTLEVPSKNKINGDPVQTTISPIPYELPTPAEIRIINRFRAIKERQKQKQPQQEVVIPKVRRLPRKVIELDYSWTTQLNNVYLI